MKIFIILIVLAINLVSAPQKKVVLVEKNSSASCPNCAAANVNFHPYIKNLEGKVIRVVYPFHGGNYIDPMGQFLNN